MTTRLNRWILALIVIVGLPYYWMLIDDRPGHVEPQPISIGQLRGLAGSVPGLAPTSIHYQRVAWRYVPRTILAAGQGIKLEPFSIGAYLLSIPNDRSILVGRGMSFSTARQFGFDHYRADHEALIQSELKKAKLVITLGDHNPQGGGVQLAGGKQPATGPNTSSACPPPHALAAGVVEIPVCGDLIASRMLYVRLDSGAEYLLTGDIAPVRENVTYQAAPSRLMNDFLRYQDTATIHSWLLTVKRLTQEAPDLTIIPGHVPLGGKEFIRPFPHTANVLISGWNSKDG